MQTRKVIIEGHIQEHPDLKDILMDLYNYASLEVAGGSTEEVELKLMKNDIKELLSGRGI